MEKKFKHSKSSTMTFRADNTTCKTAHPCHDMHFVGQLNGTIQTVSKSSIISMKLNKPEEKEGKRSKDKSGKSKKIHIK